MSDSTVYVVAMNRWGSGDFAGCVIARDKVLWQHVSSSMGFLRHDLTDNFRDRRETLAEMFPDGYETVVVGLDDPMPDEIAHIFTKADA